MNDYERTVIRSAINAANQQPDDWHQGYAAGLQAALRILNEDTPHS